MIITRPHSPPHACGILCPKSPQDQYRVCSFASSAFLLSNSLSAIPSFVITTGHMSGGHVDEEAWMTSNPEILATAKAAIVCEHFGAIEYKDTFKHNNAKPVYKATGKMEPMWTMAYVSFTLYLSM